MYLANSILPYGFYVHFFIIKKKTKKISVTCLFVETITLSFIGKCQHSQERQTNIFGSYECKIRLLNQKDTQESGLFAALIYEKNSMGKFQK